MTIKPENPDKVHLGSYYECDRGVLTRIPPGSGAVDPHATLIHDQFRALLLSEAYPCLGGRSAVRTDCYRLGVYPELGTETAVRDCAFGLWTMLADWPRDSHSVAVLVAVFDGPAISDELDFERALWRQLNAMHRLDAARSGFTETSPITLNEDDDGFFFGDRTFFIVGLNPAASRWARRFGWPTLIFNSLTHDTVLRSRGQYERMQRIIRRRDTRLQGAPNPSVDLPQMAQFSGRPVSQDWQCPREEAGGER